MMSRRAAATRGLCVRTSTGWVIGNTQLGCSLRWPSTSTTQTRHTPASGRSGWWHSVGIRTPPARAASRMVVPLATSTSRPSTVARTVTPAAGRAVLGRDMLVVMVAPVRPGLDR